MEEADPRLQVIAVPVLLILTVHFTFYLNTISLLYILWNLLILTLTQTCTKLIQQSSNTEKSEILIESVRYIFMPWCHATETSLNFVFHCFDWETLATDTSYGVWKWNFEHWIWKLLPSLITPSSSFNTLIHSDWETPPPPSVCLSVSLSLTHSDTHTHTHTYTRGHTSLKRIMAKGTTKQLLSLIIIIPVFLCVQICTHTHTRTHWLMHAYNSYCRGLHWGKALGQWGSEKQAQRLSGCRSMMLLYLELDLR